MRTGDTKLFLDKSRLYMMVNLRINGFALTTLAKIFGCDVSSIRHQCKKYEIYPVEDTYNMERIAYEVIINTKMGNIEWESMYGHKISKGKTYEEYLALAGYPHSNNRTKLI